MIRFLLALMAFISLLAHAETHHSDCETLLNSKLFNHFSTSYIPLLTADRAKNEKLIIRGNQKISGEVQIDPAKNAYLPILAATLLNPHPVLLKEVPRLRDIETFLEIFRTLGVKAEYIKKDLLIDASQIKTNIATCDLVKTMRASILMLGPMLARFQGGQVGLPGGCPIGSRPIDIHLNQLRKLGAQIVEADTSVTGVSAAALKGSVLDLPFPSVGATQNLMMAAVLAEGKTIIKNGAQEPEVLDLMDFLNAMGAKVTHQENGDIEVIGVKELKNGVKYRAIGDRIEAATYIIGALMTDSELLVKGFHPEHLQAVLDVLTQMGAHLEVGKDFVKVHSGSRLKAVSVTTAPHPGFPTDVQAQLMALMTQAEGVSSLQETVFESRFAHAEELRKMGAEIEIKGDTAYINGKTPLHAAQVKCTDLRAGIALIMSALSSPDGEETDLSDIYYVDRGYNRFLEKFAQMGACHMRRSEEPMGTAL